MWNVAMTDVALLLAVSANAPVPAPGMVTAARTQKLARAGWNIPNIWLGPAYQPSVPLISRLRVLPAAAVVFVIECVAVPLPSVQPSNTPSSKSSLNIVIGGRGASAPPSLGGRGPTRTQRTTASSSGCRG